MKPDWKSQWKPNISVKYNGRFYDFRVYSGHSLQFGDPEAEERVLEPDASDEALGQAVLKSLKQSRYLSSEEHLKFYDCVSEVYKNWVQSRMKQYGYKGKRALFKDMKSCSVILHQDILVIEPYKHETLEGWGGEGISEEDYVKIAADSSLSEIGSALRLAFTRCK